jgi:hypothetical protein
MTMHLLRSLPLCDCVFGCAYFSRIPNDGSIAPHTGPTNIKLRLQLHLYGHRTEGIPSWGIRNIALRRARLRQRCSRRLQPGP